MTRINSHAPVAAVPRLALAALTLDDDAIVAVLNPFHPASDRDPDHDPATSKGSAFKIRNGYQDGTDALRETLRHALCGRPVRDLADHPLFAGLHFEAETDRDGDLVIDNPAVAIDKTTILLVHTMRNAMIRETAP